MRLIRMLAQLDRWGTVLVVFLLPWHARWIFESGLLRGVPSEPLTGAIAALEVLIVALLFVRVVRQVRRDDPVVLSTASRTVLAIFGALIGLALFSVLVSSATIATVYAVEHLLIGLALLYLMLTAPHAREVWIAFLVSMCVQSGIAIVQASFQAVYPFSWFGVAAHYPDLPGTSVVEAGGMRWLRAYGTFPHPNILGGALAIAILVARKLFARFSPYAAAVYALLTVGLFLSFSRLAWIALVVGLITQLVVERGDRRLAYTTGVVAAIAIILAIIFSPLVGARVSASGRLETKSVTTRLGAIRDAQTLWVAHPLVGIGAGAFSSAIINEIDSTRSGYDVEPVHDVPLLVLAELGLFGFGVFVMLMYRCFKNAFTNRELGMALALVILALGDHWAWSTLGGILIFWAGWGMAMRKS